MTRLDEFLEPLSKGVWEVVVPKDAVTEPPDAGWRLSTINVPSPGTIASYRKGRFHVHETKTEWRVHLDRYDPKKNPLLHLVDDAPLLLMISDTFMTLIADVRRTETKGTRGILKTQGFIWQEQVLYGLVLCLAGIFILNNPLHFFRGTVELVIPLALTGLSVLVLTRTPGAGVPRGQRAKNLFRAGGIFCAGIFAFLLPFSLWVISILVLLMLWMLASAFLLLKRVLGGRRAVPEGLYSRMAIGLLSLGMAVLLFVSPAEILVLLLEILGAIALLLGITLSVNGVRLRRWMKCGPAE